jgi:Tfp pilus assembly protein PilV
MYRNNQGQSMFELLMAIAVVSIVLVALISLSTRSLGNTTFSTNKSTGTRLTQEAAEWIRGERDVSWANFVSRVDSGGADRAYCLSTLSWPGGAGVCDPNSQKVKDVNNEDTEFVREVTLRGSDEYPQGTPDGVIDTVSVGVVTYWLDGVGRREARTTTLLTNWKN